MVDCSLNNRLLYAAQAIPPIDAEIAEKGHFWTETI